MSTGSTSQRKEFLHEVVSSALKSRIASRELLPGELLPGELVLAHEFGVSRSVVRQSLRSLQEEGLVQTAPGRGSIVSQKNELHRDAQHLEGLSAQMRALGVRITTIVVSLEQVKSAGRALAFGTMTCYRVERVRQADGAPVAFIRTYLPVRVGEVLTADVLADGSLHDSMRLLAGTDVLGGDRQIRAVAATGQIADHLGLDVGAPVLLLEGSSNDQNGDTVEVFSTWHRSDRIALDLNAYTRDSSRPIAVEELRAIAQQGRELSDRIDRLTSV